MKVSGVYGIVHARTGRAYVGSSCDVGHAVIVGKKISQSKLAAKAGKEL